MQKHTPYLAILGLLVVAVAAFAPVWPYNGATNDEWSYLYAGQQGQWHAPILNRAFAFGGSDVAQFLLPDRANRIHVMHVACWTACAVMLFYGAYRLGLSGSFAFVMAATFMLYIPSNPETVRAFYIQPYSWALLLLGIAWLLLIEALYRDGWAWWIGAAVFAFISARVYEGFLPLLGVMVLWAAITLWRDSQNRSRTFAPFLLWIGAVGVGALGFLIPYIQGEARYQNKLENTAGSPAELLERSRDYLEFAFPITLTETPITTLLPALLLAGIAMLVVWKLAASESSLTPRTELGLFIGGLGLVMVAGLPFIYAGLHAEPRAQFYAAPAAALTLTAAAHLIGRVLQSRLRVSPRWSLMVYIGVLAILGVQWFSAAQGWAETQRGPAFDAKTPFFRDLLALVPAPLPETAILYTCDAPKIPAHTARLSDLFAGWTLYDSLDSELINLRFDVELLRPPTLDFEADGLIYRQEYAFDGRPRVRRYGYEQVVIITCYSGGGLQIMEQWPDSLAPQSHAPERYNPYARLSPDFISPEAAKATAR